MTKKLLILDLDETLFYAMYPEEVDATIAAGFINDRDDCDYVIDGAYPMIERPHVHKFLNWAFKTFEVAVWTSSTQDYADDVIQHLMIDQGHGTPLFTYARDRCVHSRIPNYDAWGTSGHVEYLKDLTKVKKFGFDKKDIIVVDDTPSKWKRNYGNLVRISEFWGEPYDNGLRSLMAFLGWLKNQPDIRTVEKRGWSSWEKR